MNETLEEIRKELHEMNKTLKTISGCQERNVEKINNNLTNLKDKLINSNYELVNKIFKLIK